jgi:hypothetical protein
MTDWRKFIGDGINEFRKQEGVRMTMRIIPATTIPSMLDAANKGDDVAALCGAYIKKWIKLATAAAKDGAYPACARCNMQLNEGEVSGFAVLIPDNEDLTGLSAAYCATCIVHDHGELMHDLIESVANEIGANFAMLQ